MSNQVEYWSQKMTPLMIEKLHKTIHQKVIESFSKDINVEMVIDRSEEYCYIPTNILYMKYILPHIKYMNDNIVSVKCNKVFGRNQDNEKIKFLIGAGDNIKYKLNDLLKQIDPNREISDEEIEWLDAEPVGKELI